MTRRYAGGGFSNVDGDPGADNVAYHDGGGWHAMGPPAGTCLCAVNDFVRSLTAVGTNVYAGTDATNVSSIPRADHVVRWDANALTWNAVGSNTAGTDGWFPASTFVYGMTHVGSTIYATGSFQNANGDPRADHIASFSGGAWHAVGSNGAGNGPWIGNGLAVAPFGGRVVAGGNFTSAGGDSQAGYAATYPGAFTLTVSRTGTGSGAISVNGATCSYVCSFSYAPGTTLTLSALTSVESTFTGWTGACSGSGKLRPTASGKLSLRAHNGNAFAVRAISVKVTSARAVAAAKGHPRRKVVTFLRSSKAVAIGAGKNAKLKGRLSKPRLAALKRLRRVRVRIRVVLQAPDGTRSTRTVKGTLRAPKPPR